MTMEVAEEEEEAVEPNIEEEENEEVATISLHTLHGVELAAENQTMKLIGYIKKRRLNVLIDSGSA